jgi:DNA-binding response OmpR family regulator
MHDLPVTILSSSSQSKDKAKATECCANDYFVKPASFFELVTIVGQIAHKWTPEPQQTIDGGLL